MLTASVLTDNLRLVALTIAGALPVVVVGIWLTRRSGGARAGRQALVVALAPVTATWVGAAVAAQAMFIDSRDLTAFSVIALSAGAVGVLTAWRMTRRIRVDTAALGDLSRAIARGDVVDTAPEVRVTELGELGSQLAQMSVDLHDSHARELALERSRRELVAWVSHDLRSPLAGIRAMAEALEDGVVDEPADVERYLRAIGAETDRLTSLVDDLFELSRITSGVVDVAARPTDPGEIVERVVDGVRAAAVTRGVDVRCAAGVEPARPMLVAPAEATRVLRNLVDNAVRHTPRGGSVEVGVRDLDGEVELAVTDQCGGIPEPDLDRVFDVAFRGDVARGRDHGGGGLGLTIAKGLVEAQSGSIAVANHGDGCRFTVTFPAAGVAGDDRVTT